jgi:hypothetical protein
VLLSSCYQLALEALEALVVWEALVLVSGVVEVYSLGNLFHTSLRAM